MLKSNLCYHNGKARRMKDRKTKIKFVKASLKDGIYLFVCLVIVANIFNHIEIKVKSQAIETVQAKEIIKEIPIIKEVATKDQRITKLQSFLTKNNSPLTPYSELIIAEADKWDIGWTKIVSISKMESDYGKKIPYNSHNAWGLGGSKFMYFNSWEESIEYVSRLIGTSYKTNEMQGIKSKYCPESDGCNPSWAFIVVQASTDILGIE